MLPVSDNANGASQGEQGRVPVPQLIDDEESTLVDLRPHPAWRSSQEMPLDNEGAKRRARRSLPRTLRGEGYFRHDAEAKQEALWDAISLSAYRQLPSLTAKRGSFSARVKSFMNEGMWPSAGEEHEDVSATPTTSLYHRLGATALAHFVPHTRHPFTGLVAGEGMLLMRMSLAIDPDDAFVPGLQLKWLIDGQPSANVLAMHDIDGEPEHNVFGCTLSNVLAAPRKWRTRLAMRMQGNSLLQTPVEHLFATSADGTQIRRPVSASQLLFCPTDIARSRMRGVRDFRRELPRLAVGAPIYEVYGVSEEYAEPLLMGRIELSSSFLSSEFQDTRLQFGRVR